MNFKYLAAMNPHAKQFLESVLKTMVIFLLLIGLWGLPCNGQADTVKTLKNTVLINVSNPLIFGSRYKVIGYERVIKDYQTASVSIGTFGFPKLKEFSSDSLGLSEQYHDRGFHISFDYRFYLKNENKHVAPRGVYVGPYYAFNSFSRDMTWDLNTTNFTGEVITNIDLRANLVGLQLGYQFILWKRLSIDLILMGPSVWFLNLKTGFDTSLSSEDETLMLEKLNEMLKEKFPGSDLVIQGGGFQAKKTTRTSVMGFRYLINLGFRF
jgi:hypothetical protein